MATLITLLQLLVVWLVAYLMGLAVVKALLPEDIERSHGFLVTPTVGYLTFCMLAFTISATFNVNAGTASWAVMAALILAGLATQLRPAWRLDMRSVARDARRSVLLVAPMALVTLLPFFFYGADTYLGAVNPDYFAGVVDNYFLMNGHSVATFSGNRSTSFYPIEYIAGHLSASARFGAEIFGIAAQQLLGTQVRTALSLVIAFFLLSLPLTLYFLCRVVLAFGDRAATWAAWLIGISAPTAMSYLYYYLGQNSGLPALPLLLAACFLMLERPGFRTLLFAALLSNAMFINYFAMLPYALAPTGALGLYLLATRRLSPLRAFAIAGGFVGILAAFKLGDIGNTISSMRAWANIIGQSLQGQFFLDFLTESFFAYFLGLINYPSNPWVQRLVGNLASRIAAFTVSLVILGLLGWFIVQWVRRCEDRSRKVFVVSALAIYTAVWARYSFAQQYGYAVFKMSSWLQFVVVSFMAYGITALRERLAAGPATGTRRWPVVAALAVCGIYGGLNLVMSLQYAYDGTGRNTDTGYIINHFGTAGNRDYFALTENVGRFVKPEQSIGLVFTDSIRNYWTSFYLRDFRQSLLAHESLPGDDENLPDIQTGNVVDYYGNVREARNEYFHDGTSDEFYLTWSPTDLNQDIVKPWPAAKPLWENGSFRLFRAADSHDILFTGRGFYRLEYFKPITQFFFPRVIRWSAEGGEFYLLHPKFPGQEYRLAFDAIVGYELPSDSRTLEIWQDGRKLQELVVTSSARVVSVPFRPSQGVTKLVVTIKERNRPLPRQFRLWNREIPSDYRRANVAFANAAIVTPETSLAPAPKLGQRVEFLGLHPMAEQFNGLQLDGWLGDHAEFTIPMPQGARTLRIEGTAPGNLGFTYPYEVTVAVNGSEVRRTIERAGAFSLELPAAPRAGRASVVLRMPQSVPLRGEEAIRHKLVTRSIRLDAVTFRP